MTPQEFMDNFGTLADAPGGIKKLRELVLELAVRGQLTTRLSDDGAADKLLNDVRRHRGELAAKRLIRGGAPAPVAEAEALFQLPSGWAWARFGDLGEWGAGATPSRTNPLYYGGTTIWLKSGELNDGYVSTSEEKVTDKALKDCSLRLNKPGDVLIAMYGATIGKTAILQVEGTTNQAVCACTCFPGVFNQYLVLALRAFKRGFVGQGAGGAQPNISKEKIVATPVPLPPLAEQKRIVAKVDQLMALLDDLEAKQGKRQHTVVRATSACLDALTAADSPEEVADAWKRVAGNWRVLFDRPEAVGGIKKLRELVLDLALQGRLGPQHSQDEPARVLLSRMAAERANARPARRATGAEVANPPFSVPSSWAWAKLADIWRVITDGDHQPPPKVESGIAFLTIGNVSGGTLDFTQTRFVGKEYYSGLDPDRVPAKGDLLYTVVGSFGKPVLVDVSRPFCVQRHIAILKPLKDTDVRFWWHAMKSGLVFRQAAAAATGIAQPTVGLGSLRNFDVPVPPLAEQDRIVAKVDQLMALCDDLEAKLRHRDDRAGKLVAAVVGEMVSG